MSLPGHWSLLACSPGWWAPPILLLHLHYLNILENARFTAGKGHRLLADSLQSRVPSCCGARHCLLAPQLSWVHVHAGHSRHALREFWGPSTRPERSRHPVQVPTYAGYDWHAVALILVSWYTATAGYAASASFRPATAAAVLLVSVFCALLLLSGAVAPTLRTMYAHGRLFYGLSGGPHFPSTPPWLCTRTAAASPCSSAYHRNCAPCAPAAALFCAPQVRLTISGPTSCPRSKAACPLLVKRKFSPL